MRILGYCLMPNHWHFVLWPENDGDLGRFMQRLTITHVTCRRRHYNMVGYGHMYQGRFKSFPVETDDYFYQVMRYTERNGLRANLVARAEDWPWGSLWIRQFGSAERRAMLSDWPMPRPRSWVDYVNQPASDAELTPFDEVAVVCSLRLGSMGQQNSKETGAGDDVAIPWTPKESIKQDLSPFRPRRVIKKVRLDSCTN